MKPRPVEEVARARTCRRASTRWRVALCCSALSALCACQRAVLPTADGPPPHISHGTAVGEVTSSSAVLWARCDRDATLHVRLDGSEVDYRAAVSAASDFTARIPFVSLTPATSYGYRAWCATGADAGGDASAAARGVFRSAPAPDAPAAVRFGWSGDVGGQNVCRDRERGYPIFALLAERELDFFLAVGDMIYADDNCHRRGRYRNAQIPGPPPAFDLSTFWAHWRYNRDDPASQRMLARVPYFAVWDDHEIRNDSGPQDDAAPLAAGGRLLPHALRAFLDYQPLLPPADDPTRLYRAVRWGRHVELFLLDTRQYRDALGASDAPDQPKTLLGARQLAWLEAALAQSDATWKIIVASVPLSIPTGSLARDGFADGGAGGGYEREAARIFAALRAHGIRNSLWITTDVHFATGFIYRPFADDPSWTAHELISGPLNAGLFPTLTVDPTFRPERLFIYGPSEPGDIDSFDQALGWFNFGVIDVSAAGALTVSFVNGRDETVFRYSIPAGDR